VNTFALGGTWLSTGTALALPLLYPKIPELNARARSQSGLNVVFSRVFSVAAPFF